MKIVKLLIVAFIEKYYWKKSFLIDPIHEKGDYSLTDLADTMDRSCYNALSKFNEHKNFQSLLNFYNFNKLSNLTFNHSCHVLFTYTCYLFCFLISFFYYLFYIFIFLNIYFLIFLLII